MCILTSLEETHVVLCKLQNCSVWTEYAASVDLARPASTDKSRKLDKGDVNQQYKKTKQKEDQKENGKIKKKTKEV